MSDLELIQKCIKDLGAINVPAALLEQIAIPVYNVRQNLIGLANAIETQLASKSEPAEPTESEEPVLQAE